MPETAAGYLPPDRGSADQPAASGRNWERRRQPRLKLGWPVRLFHLSRNLVIESTTRNLSSSGFYCLSPVSLEPSDLVECVLSLPAHDLGSQERRLPLHCKVRILRVEHEAQDGLAGIACRIEDYHFGLPAGPRQGPPLS